MYSVLLAAALTAGTAEVPAWHGGCYGCCGGNAFSYGCCGGCWGCCGGNAFSSSCYGCCGGCWGCCGGGCWGCWGCSGCYGVSCYGCCGGCCGGWSCWGCSGGYSCTGCYGSWGCTGGGCGGVIISSTPSSKPAASSADKGKVSVHMPADASLYVDGMKADLTSSVRTFETPALIPGHDYYYTIRIEAVRDGETLSQSRRVTVRAGQTSEVAFGEFSAAAKAEAVSGPARVTVKLPADAKLYVDGVLCPQTSAVRSFETPRLDAGVTYAYTLKAELVRDGRTRVETKRVEMQAGKEVNIEFVELSGVQSVSR